MGKKQKASLGQVRSLIEQGFTYRQVEFLTGWSRTAVSQFAVAWGLKRPRGRRPAKEQANGGK